MKATKTKEINPASSVTYQMLQNKGIDKPVLFVKDLARFLEVSIPTATKRLKTYQEMGFRVPKYTAYDAIYTVDLINFFDKGIVTEMPMKQA